MANANAKVSEEALGEQVAVLRDDLAKITQTLAELTKGQARNVREAAKDKVVALGERGKEKLDDAGVLLSEAEKKATTFVREKPVQSLAIAAAIGLAAGYLTRSK